MDYRLLGDHGSGAPHIAYRLSPMAHPGEVAARNIPMMKYREGKAFERGIRRHVHAETHQFAVSTAPELKGLCLGELEKLGFGDAHLSEAGVELKSDFDACYTCNLWLRTGGRVLIRLPSFRAGILEELFAKASSMRWELWLDPTVPLDVQAHVERSRVQHEGRVAIALTDAICRRFRLLDPAGQAVWEAATPPSTVEEGETGGLRQRVLVHLDSNHCTISLDTTGEHLHRRGYRLAHSGAPLRETLAAAMLIKAGWKGEIPLVDGMSGAGTLAIEAAMMARGIPPGAHRSFLFERWPAFREKKWLYLKRKAMEHALSASPVRIVAVDKQPQTMELARQNGRRALVEDDVEWALGDFFEFDPASLSLPPGLLALNPPYGIRLRGGGRQLYERIGAHIRRAFRGWQVAVIAPDRASAIALRLPSIRLWNMTHGGMEVMVVQAHV